MVVGLDRTGEGEPITVTGSKLVDDTDFIDIAGRESTYKIIFSERWGTLPPHLR